MTKQRGSNSTGTMRCDDVHHLYIYRISVGIDNKGQATCKVFSGRTQEVVLDKLRE
jgi:hypothetical protein